MKGTPYIDPHTPEPNYRNGSTTAREVELISRIAQGDRKAFEELYGLYHRRLSRFLTRLTKRYDVAEEVINDTFYIVWRKAGDFRGESQPSTWILGIAYRKARNAFRSSSRILAVENPDAPLPPLTSDESLRTEELRDWLSQALVQLPVEQRLAVELCYQLGYSCEEISTIMSCPVNTVKTRLFHARAKLQKLLPALGGILPKEGGGRSSSEVEGKS
ncbi:MAG TPA: RNA polymerase sigma factor [Steroidobacteraceae bacterium]